MALDLHALARALRTEAAALREFVALLRAEQQALVSGKLESISSFRESKSIYMFELNRLAEQRRTTLISLGMSADRAGMEKLLRERAGAGSEPDSAWRQLIELASTAQQLNDTNGTLIRTRLNGTQQALSVLFSAANLMNGTYTPDGGTTLYRKPQQLAVA
jgi:flagella synthesis protein FlgN